PPFATSFLIPHASVLTQTESSLYLHALCIPAADRAATFHSSSVRKRKEAAELPSHFLLEGTIWPRIMLAATLEEGSCINFREMTFIDNTLYFTPEDDGDLESDNFSKLQSITTVIRNMSDQVLFVDKRKSPVFEDMPDADQRANPQTRLIIYMYKDSEAGGMAVTLSVKHEKMFTLSCKDKVISFEEMDPPENIDDTKSDLIFFKRGVPGHNKMQFESSMHEGHFLACEKEGDFFKLILKKKDENGDKSVMFTVTSLPQS
ncbi:Il18, partial [Lemmus lemmus]